MTSQPGRPARPALNLHGAVDLSGLAPRRPPAGAATGLPGGAANGGAPDAAAGQNGVIGDFVLDATDASFGTDVIEMSSTVPVVIDFWATWCEPCKQLSPILETLAAEYAGRILLAKVDVDANPQLAQAFQVQSIPSVFAVIKGQPVPMFQGAQPEPQVRQILAELVKVAEANGVTGRLAAGDAAPGPDEEPIEEPLPPLHQAAYDAIERDDLDAAVAAYEQALNETPADELARIGLAQVRLMQRTQDADPVTARASAAAAPTDVDAQILAADVDVLSGEVGAAFTRLVAAVRATSGEERDRVRQHLVELFEVVGGDDPEVVKARIALANALF